MNYTIREIKKEDNSYIESIIRECLIAYGGNHEGTAWSDPDLGRFSEIYGLPGKRYWVGCDEQGHVLGGVGIGPLEGMEGVCELQKMYCCKEARGTGLAKALLETALDYAKGYYQQVYLETLSQMVEAKSFYKKHGFKKITQSLGETEHFACEDRYLLDLNEHSTVL